MSDHLPHAVDVHVGQRIRMARRELSMSQDALAERCGVTFQQIQKYERGANRVSASMLWMIARTQEKALSFYFDGLPQAPEEERPAERIIREYAQSGPGRSLLEAASSLPVSVVMAHVEALHAAGAAISLAKSGPKVDA